MAGTNDLSKRDVTPEDIINGLNDSITIMKQFSNVGQIFYAGYFKDLITTILIRKSVSLMNYFQNISWIS